MTFLGEFVCEYHNGCLRLPQAFCEEGLRLDCRLGLAGGPKLIEFSPPAKGSPGLRNRVCVHQGAIMLPAEGRALFPGEARLVLTGLGKSFVARLEGGRQGWHTNPLAKITLAAVGKAACGVMDEFSISGVPMDCSCTQAQHRVKMLSYLKIGFDMEEGNDKGDKAVRISLGLSDRAASENLFIALDRARAAQKEISRALNGTGLLILTACLADADGAGIIQYVYRLAGEKGIDVLCLGILPDENADFCEKMNARSALYSISKMKLPGAVVLIDGQKTAAAKWGVPSVCGDFRTGGNEARAEKLIPSILQYAVSALLLPYMQAESLPCSSACFREIFFGKGMLAFSLNVFSGDARFEQCMRDIGNTLESLAVCHASIFGASTLGQADLGLLSSYIIPRKKCSAFYGQWSGVGHSLLLLKLSRYTAEEELADTRKFAHWVKQQQQYARREYTGLGQVKNLPYRFFI